MRVLTVIVAILGILMASSSVFAQDIQKEQFFGASVDRFITSCEHKASMMGSNSASIRRDAAIASVKAAFYNTHKEQLINQMLSQNLDIKRGDVDYFLVKSFYRFCEADLARSLAETFQSMTTEGKRTSIHVGMKNPDSAE